MVFGINSTRNADRKANSTRLRLVLFCTFLSALLVLLIPNTTEKHAITYTNMVHVLYVHLCNLHVYMYTNLCVCGGGGMGVCVGGGGETVEG